MARYDARILNGLLDSYENSILSRGENKVKIHISFSFTKKTLPEYFDESSLVYDEIHAAMKELEHKGFLTIVWKKGKAGHIIEKVLLKEEKIDAVYSYMKRPAKADHIKAHIDLLENWRRRTDKDSIAHTFSDYLLQRITAGKSVKEFINLADLKRTERLLFAISMVEGNQEDCYIREFSIRNFGDSKIFETMFGVIGKVIRRFRTEFSEMDIYAILAEYRIYHTPNYVYLKGEGQLAIQREPTAVLELSSLKQGIGISGADLKNIKIQNKAGIKKVITIENLTTFFRWQEEKSLIIYLGGYHNSVRRELLCMLYQELPNAEYLHFGDIDVGGFEIYRDLCEKTGIPFHTYHMGIEELKMYKEYAKKLTDNDRKRLKKMIENRQTREVMEVLKYMESNQVKLEQEALGV